MVDTKIETSRLAKASQEYDVTKTRRYGAAVKSESDNKPCKYWNSRGACDRGESCAFWHDLSKKAQPRTPSPGKEKGKNRSGSRGKGKKVAAKARGPERVALARQEKWQQR